MDDQYHLEGAIDQFTSKSVIRCLSDCSSRLQCMSFFYNKDTMDCILHSDSFIYTVPTEQGDGWRFYLTEDVSGRCPSSNEFKYYRALDLCYSIHAPVQIDFTAIKTFCANIGGELIRISSEQIQQYIQKVTAADPTERICIQGTDTINPTNWTFDDGTPMTYFNWDTDADEPSGNRGRLEIFTNYKWHDLPSTSSNQCLRICERMRII
ncbi:Hypothetical predicted protein [Mytilus galloprovincialis]|uniref:C-type lectin domain-containing protein n=1 Tax=Mytilus galloprovincialis TaxID=29158 RepID=A0A8B6DFV9_MYTGA|nr:Hypothetical predicted protein [Mytilus galloprovincialis]